MLDIKKIMSEVSAASRSATQQMSDGLADIRDHIVELKQERSAIIAMPVAKEVAMQRAETVIDTLTRDSKLLYPQPCDFARPNYQGSNVSVATLLAAQLATQMIETMQAQIEDFYATTKGVSEDERRRLLHGIDQKLLDAEFAEESVIRAAEAADIPIFRRRNADPRAVLAHDEVLP